MSNIIPPRQPPLEVVNIAEFLALRVIVMNLVTAIANHIEALGGESAQDWINRRLAVSCHELLSTAEIGHSDPEKVRREAVEHVNKILGGIHFPRGLQQ